MVDFLLCYLLTQLILLSYKHINLFTTLVVIPVCGPLTILTLKPNPPSRSIQTANIAIAENSTSNSALQGEKGFRGNSAGSRVRWYACGATSGCCSIWALRVASRGLKDSALLMVFCYLINEFCGGFHVLFGYCLRCIMWIKFCKRGTLHKWPTVFQVSFRQHVVDIRTTLGE